MSIDLDKIKNSIVSVGKDVGNKVNDVTAIAKVKLDIHTKEEYAEKQFTQLGRAYYLAHKNDEDVPEIEFFKRIAEAEEEIMFLKDELLTLQGARICKNCGVKQPQGNTYCQSCGAKFNK